MFAGFFGGAPNIDVVDFSAVGEDSLARAYIMSPVQDFRLTEEYWQESWSDSDLDQVSLFLALPFWQSGIYQL